ncbi:hypothetical protein FSB73_16535 [Arachidicoccus ginsenosidivorans]|jgi:hypothetical protein|uniref:Uncharacterized protein n=1 Tax=Arachidicoccus ginsenosidivorans TaxID=496057 RepID=A0A5B8VRY5_9BACT|nr:hypothetical protein [Arachidicoccus ginsenosidivorans]QEC73048.1 hypothetical protein FSB73_16535 [Arachidicoccus ginsenosidivorans]
MNLYTSIPGYRTIHQTRKSTPLLHEFITFYTNSGACPARPQKAIAYINRFYGAFALLLLLLCGSSANTNGIMFYLFLFFFLSSIFLSDQFKRHHILAARFTLKSLGAFY